MISHKIYVDIFFGQNRIRVCFLLLRKYLILQMICNSNLYISFFIKSFTDKVYESLSTPMYVMLWNLDMPIMALLLREL